MLKKIKQFASFSGSDVSLYRSLDGYFVRKINNVQRNIDQLKLLEVNGFLIPKVFYIEDNLIDMEYIDGSDIKTLLMNSSGSSLLKFITETMLRFKSSSYLKDYTNVYHAQLTWLQGYTQLPFTVTALINKLPKVLPTSLCHGDFTFDNLIYKQNFYMIDPSTGPYNSYVFDLAKLRQDLDGKWFLRNSVDVNIDDKLVELSSELKQLFPEAFDDMLYILMLIRVLKYTTPKSKEEHLIINEIDRIWKY